MKLKALLCAFLSSPVIADGEETAEPLATKPADEKGSADFTDDEKKTIEETGEKHEFQAEVSRLMDIIINSLYTERQVFLRELVSNSADALEKARFHSVEDKSFLGEQPDLELKIEFDEEKKTLSITDTGIGMTKADLINNLGTVAKSGTTNFLEAMQNGGDANLIGQFGVGFYAAFLVADKITVTSKHNDDKQHIWESSADASFSVVEDPRGDTLKRGTCVKLHMKEDAHEFLSENVIKDIVKKYSQFVTFPIYQKVKKEVVDDDDDDDEPEEKDEDEEDEEEPEVKEKEYRHEWEQLNTVKPIWMRSKDEITEDEYMEFYKSITRDSNDPLSYTHFAAEGEIEFRSILYLPSKMSSDMLNKYHETKSEIKLFVRRVLVADNFADLLPKYLNFVRGVVDSDDLPLNVSREQLQQNKIMKVIAKKIVRKILELMKNLAKKDDKSDEDDDEDDAEEDKKEKDDDDGEEKEKTQYDKFYDEFKSALKMGCQEDDANRSKVSKLLRFESQKRKNLSLDQYLDKMTEKQPSIYYMAGDDITVMKNSPNMQIFNKKNLEVILLTDPLDEGCIQRLSDFEGKKFVSIQKSDLKLEETEEEKKRFKKLTTMYEPLTKWWKDTLKDLDSVQIGSVELSKRLTDAPLTVVSSQFGYSATQERMMKAQAFSRGQQAQGSSKNLEINPNHPVVVDLLQKVQDDPSDEKAKKTAEILFQTALVEQGYELPNPAVLSKRIYDLMSAELGVDPAAEVKEIEVPEDEEEEKKDDEEEDVEVEDAPAADGDKSAEEEPAVEEPKKDEL